MITDTLPGIKNLSSQEKLQLIGELWDDLTRDPNCITIPQELIEELDRRLKAYEENPEDVRPWEETKKRILSSNS